jgi:hypothetical protein
MVSFAVFGAISAIMPASSGRLSAEYERGTESAIDLHKKLWNPSAFHKWVLGSNIWWRHQARKCLWKNYLLVSL